MVGKEFRLYRALNPSNSPIFLQQGLSAFLTLFFYTHPWQYFSSWPSQTQVCLIRHTEFYVLPKSAGPVRLRHIRRRARFIYLSAEILKRFSQSGGISRTPRKARRAKPPLEFSPFRYYSFIYLFSQPSSCLHKSSFFFSGSAMSRSTIFSIRMPCDPLINRMSPGFIIFSSSSAARSDVSKV